MRHLLLTLAMVFGPLTTAESAITPRPETPQLPYIVYMSRFYVQDVDFFVYFLIMYERSPELAYIINIDGRMVVEELLPYDPVRIIKIGHGNFTGNHNHIVHVMVYDWDGILFDKSVQIKHSSWKGPTPGKSLFVQKDKAHYQPKDKVRFRCFGLNNQFQTFKDPMNIKLYDPKNNLRKIWTNESSLTGVISADAQLSDKPVFGKWTLHINQLNSDLEKNVTFDVKESVPPSMRITLSGDKYVYYFAMPTFFLSRYQSYIYVDARYSFGGSVQGELILQATLVSNNKYSIQITKAINGKSLIRISLARFLRINKISLVPYYSNMPRIHSFKITAVVHEKETGSKIESSPMILKIAPAPIEIDAFESIAYKPGLPLTFEVHIKRVDGKPLIFHECKRPLNVTYFTDKGAISSNYTIPSNGNVKITAPFGIYKYIKISYYGIYQGCRYTRTRKINVQMFHSPINAYMKVTFGQSKIYVGDQICGTIQSTVPLENIHFLVLKVVTPVATNATSVSISDNGFFAKFCIESKKYWYPGVKIIFTCITNSGNILVDILSVKLEAKFKYKVDGHFSPKINRPGNSTQLKMETAPESALFVMSVDEQLSNKFITKEEIFSRIGGSYSVRTSFCGNSFQHIIYDCGFTFMSNKIEAMPKLIASMKPFLAIGEASTTEDNAVLHDDFQDVWIWAERNVSSRGKMTLSAVTPDRITTWQTHAFAVHPEKGISVLEKPLEFVSDKKMFIKLSLPYSVIMHEKFKLVARVFNNIKFYPVLGEVSVTVAASGLKWLDGRSRTITFQDKGYKIVEFEARAERVGHVHITMSLHSGGVVYDVIGKTLVVKRK